MDMNKDGVSMKRPPAFPMPPSLGGFGIIGATRPARWELGTLFGDGARRRALLVISDSAMAKYGTLLMV